jgi:very-short-patch-repair endonuclease
VSLQRNWRTDAKLWAELRESARAYRAKSTPAEARLWHVLRNRGIAAAKFRRQFAIDRFLVDFYCSEAALVIEIDGPMHDALTVEDAERQQELESRGLTVLRFTNAEVIGNLDAVIAKIAAYLTSAASVGNQPRIDASPAVDSG